MKNRKLLLIVSLVLALTMSLGGTLAYLQDTDSDVNIMTVGNVDITQLENDKADGGFENGKPLYPAYYEGDDWMQADADDGMIEKRVNVKNEGPSEAYVRTLIAFEAGNLSTEDFDKYIHTAWETKPEWIVDDNDNYVAINVKGVNYYVAYVDYDVVAAGVETAESLQKIVMDKTANNDIVAQFGDTYETLVLSQAIQTNNFPDKATAWTEGFGEMTPDNVAKWFGGIAQIPVNTVSTVEDLLAAIAEGGTVILGDDIVIAEADIKKTDAASIPVAMLITMDTVLDLNGNTITFPNTAEGTAGIHVLDADLTITGNGTIEQNGTNDYLLWAKGDKSTVTIKDGTFKTAPNDCTVLYASNYEYDTPPGATINVYGGTFISGNPADGQDCANVMNHGSGSINYYGGSFNWHPEDIHDGSGSDDDFINVAEGYKVVDLGAGQYMVVANDVNNVVANADQLAAAVAAGETDIVLAAGTYNVANCGGKTLTISGTKDAVLKLYNEGESGCDYGFDGSTVTFNGVTIDTTANTGAYKGYARMKGTYNDCAFVGEYATMSFAHEFNNCTFNTNNGYVWTWSATEVTFNNCTFDGVNTKSILAHGGVSTKITVNNCAFKSTDVGLSGGTTPVAVVEIDPISTNTYTINFSGNNTKTDSYAGWTRVKDDSTGHIITGLN